MVIHDYWIQQHLISKSRPGWNKRIKHVEVQWKGRIQHCSWWCNGWVGPQMLQVLIMCYCRGVGIYRKINHCPQLLHNNNKNNTGRWCWKLIYVSEHLTIYVFSVADVLEVAARVLAAQLRLGPVRLQPGVVVPPVLGTRRHAAGGCIPHAGSRFGRWFSASSVVWAASRLLGANVTEGDGGGLKTGR